MRRFLRRDFWGRQGKRQFFMPGVGSLALDQNKKQA
jgi:hypothetical protein